jgi:hypothetical protein
MRNRLLFTIAIPIIALTACQTAPSPEAHVPSVASAGQLSPGLAAAPSQPGNSGVFRFTDALGFFIYDFESGLLSLHGSTTLFTDICAGVTPPVFEPIDIQTVASASGLQWIFRDVDHPVQIYPAVPFGCPSLAVTPRLAAGTARIIRTDNDLFGDPRAMNTTGWQATGLLDDLANGGTARYNEIVRVRFDPGTGEVVEMQVQVRLQ